MKSTIIILFSLFFSNLFFAQKSEYTVTTISDSLKNNANAVIRLSDITITISSQNAMIITTKVVTTVLNEFGLRNLNLSENYDKNRKVSKIEAIAYDAFGKELKSFRKKDFKDVSVADGISIFNDNRVLYLDYTPTVYPFTMVYESQIETSNTAFIPSWSPVDDYYVSTENTKLTISFKPELKVNFKELNFSKKYLINKTSTNGQINFYSANVQASKKEELAPVFSKVFPLVIFGLDKFHLEGINGVANSWNEMGKWFYDNILNGTTELPEETKVKVKNLVANETDPLKKAEIIYKYVQDKTRYVSIQEGIGGWKPMNAKDVDKLGYGDCKALTNYTRALLNEVGVQSFYSRLYGQNTNKEIYSDLVSFQSNHVILAIPNKNDYLWLECTSQIQPFGFQGGFTGNRNAFLIKPDGGEIVRTKTFDENDNLKQIKGSYKISDDGKITATLKIESFGLQYDNQFQKERLSKEDQIKNYKEEYSNINNISFSKINFINDKNKIKFTEEFELEAKNYAQNVNGKLMFAINAFDQSSYVPKKHRTRELPFEIESGYTDEEEITVTLPYGYVVEAKPNGAELKTEFGSYKIDFIISNNKNIICKRKLIINKGFYESSKFENYRKFRETIAKTDNSKVVISKT
ncbi:MAG TPA: DUF3857 domain-containing protein [Flavobacterium sp.]|jgi:hypothetical protein|uniref:DUF3857 domain-containing protein n=1 Tax=Flavobacterium sp. TaxID=239 RepID=UPI002B94C1AC|nr:DUF3857 domain-containing protein [Flavobacterium sp.]HPW97375.1 DUF3857 domain-containing protein [Flavobacterium sp.]HQA74152.1 DUF3857 domain-containing protein [Flavobacterium sp.]